MDSSLSSLSGTQDDVKPGLSTPDDANRSPPRASHKPYMPLASSSDGEFLVVDADGKDDVAAAAHGPPAHPGLTSLFSAADNVAPDAVDTATKPHPFHLPELLDMILSHIDGVTLNSAVLRTSKAFYAALHPKLYDEVDVSRFKASTLALVNCLLQLDESALRYLKITTLRLYLRQSYTNLMPAIEFITQASSSINAALQQVELFLQPIYDADAEVVTGLVDLAPDEGQYRNGPGMLFFNGFTFDALRVGGSGPWANLVGTVRTFFGEDNGTLAQQFDADGDALMSGCCLRDLCRLSFNSRGMDTKVDTLVIGPTFEDFLEFPGVSAVDKKQWALAQRVSVEMQDRIGMRVVWPDGLDLTPWLAEDETWLNVGTEATRILFRDGHWPVI